MTHSEVLIITLVILVGFICQWLAWRVKMPAILFLLLAGLAMGPFSGWLNVDELFGPMLMPFISLSVAVILFEGSLTLKFAEFEAIQLVVRRLVTIGALATWLIIALGVHELLGFSWELSFLFGAITVVTGPTVIVPLLRAVKPTVAVANILRWEGIVIDPIGAVLGVLVFQFIIVRADSEAIGPSLLVFLKTLMVSFIFGSSAGYGLGVLLRRHSLPDYIHNFATLAFVLGAFTASNEFQHESGLLTVTIMGLVLANMKRVSTDHILNFKESLSLLLISGLFILLASRVDIQSVLQLGWSAVYLFLVIQFVARPVCALISTWGSALTWGERLVIAWIAPRGIVAAATAAVFSSHLLHPNRNGEGLVPASGRVFLSQTDMEQVKLLVPLTFMVIISTVVMQSLTARLLALSVGVAQAEDRGVLIVGANKIAREIAKALQECEFDVLLADTDWESIKAARMEGLATYYGHVVSEHADNHLDLMGMGYLLALSEHPEVNTLACQRYRSEFGSRAVYSILPVNYTSTGLASHFSVSPNARVLFGKEVNLEVLEKMLDANAKIYKTILTEQHSFQDYLSSHRSNSVCLFAIKPNGAIEFFVSGKETEPKSQWTVVALRDYEPDDTPIQMS